MKRSDIKVGQTLVYLDRGRDPHDRAYNTARAEVLAVGVDEPRDDVWRPGLIKNGVRVKITGLYQYGRKSGGDPGWATDEAIVRNMMGVNSRLIGRTIYVEPRQLHGDADEFIRAEVARRARDLAAAHAKREKELAADRQYKALVARCESAIGELPVWSSRAIRDCPELIERLLDQIDVASVTVPSDFGSL